MAIFYLVAIDYMNERIKELRKVLGLTLEKFGERLGVKKAAISKWENGDNVTEQMIRLICREYGVSEDWLRNGTGEIFTTLSEDEELAEVINDIILEDSNFYNLIFNIAKSYRALDDSGKAVVNSLIDNALNEMHTRKS